jgi:hypothetical protein
MTMIDPGWDLWDAKRVRTALWPSTEDWPHGDELWPDVAIRPPGERRLDLAPVRASEVERMPGALWITYWAWAVGTPFVKIGRTRYEPGRDGRWRGKAELARRRIREWATGCMYPVRLIRVHLDDSEHEAIEHALRAVARVTPQREWFDLRRL